MITSAASLSSRLSGVFTSTFLAFAFSGCEIQGSDNVPNVPDLGLFMYAEANRHEAEDTAQVAAAVFKDGDAVNLLGGDVFEAHTDSERVLLKEEGFYKDSYAASLPIDNSVQDVFFNVVHEPLEAREHRWYPIDLVYIDPGPGELVGKSATVSFPQPVTITGPLPDTVYTSVNDDIVIDWVEFNDGDTMRVLSAVECTDGLATSSYGTVIEIGADIGSATISMDKFIYDTNLGSKAIVFITDAALVLLQETLNQLSSGNIDPNFLAKTVTANPINSICDIRLFLQRRRQGQFDVTFDDGTVFGSTSAEVTVTYYPSVTTN